MNEKHENGMVYLPVKELHPHPDNPRKEIGDVSELAESIKVNGILQNLTVVPNMVTGELTGDTRQRGYKVIIGHRRLAAAKLAGLETLPCVVVNLSERDQLHTMLTENMQRSDLTLYEQAQGFQLMLDLGDTVEEIAKKSGFSASTVRRRVKLLELDKEKFKKSETRGATLQEYVELDKINDPELKNKVLDCVGTANFKNELKRAVEQEALNKRMAAWKAELEAFATKIEQRDYVGEQRVPMDYVRNFSQWSGDVSVERPEDADTVRYYFRVSSDQIDLYKDHQERVESDEERRQKEVKAAWERRTAALKEIAERHFSLRMEFVKNFGWAKTYMKEISRFAAGSIIGNAGWRSTSIDVDVLGELLDLEINDSTEQEELKELVAKVAKDKPEYVLLACAYAAEDNEESGYFERYWSTEERAYVVRYTKNEALDRIYALLEKLSYELSDEEKAMRDGTHELFRWQDEDTVDTVCAACKAAHLGCDQCCRVCTEPCNAVQDCQREEGEQK